MANSTLTVRAELGGLRKDLQDLGGVTEEQAQRMVISLEKRIKKAEDAARAASRGTEKAAKDAARAAERAAKQAEDAWNRGTESIAKKVAEKFGGVGSDFLDMATDAGGAIGTVGVAVAAGAAGAAVLAAAMVGGAMAVGQVIDSAQEARERLKDMAAVAPLSGDTIDALDAWKETSRAASVQADVLTAKVGGMAAAAFLPAMNAAVGLATELDDLLPSISTVVDTIDTLQTGVRIAAGVLSLGATELGLYALGLDDVSASGDLATQTIARFEETQRLLQAHAEPAKAMLQLTEQAMLAETGASSARLALFAQTEAIDKVTSEYVNSLNELNISSAEQLAMANAANATGELRKTQLLEQLDATEAAAQASKDKAAADRAAAAAARATADAERDADAALRDHVAGVKLGQKAFQDIADAEAAAAISAMHWADAQREAAVAQREFEADVARLAIAVDDATEKWTSAGFAVQIWGAQLQGVIDSPAVQALGDLAGDLADEFMAANEREIAALEDRHDRQVQNFEDERARRQRNLDDWLQGEADKIDALQESGELSANEASNERKRLQLELLERKRVEADANAEAKKQLEDKHKRQRDLALKAFKENQAIQRVQATIEGFRAGISLIPAYFYLGPGAPAAAAFTAAAGVGIAIAGINAQKPPEFPMGRLALTPPGSSSPDHTVSAALQPTESVNTTRGTELLGRHNIERASRGQAPGGQPILLAIGGRVVATAVVDALGKATLDPRAGKRDPWRG